MVMFEKWAQMMQTRNNPFDPAQLNDPVAMQTSWRPARGGGSNFRTYKLVRVSPDRVEFKSTVGAVLFSLIFALPGTALLIFLVPHVNWSAVDGGITVGLLLGLVFAGLGGFMLYRQMIPIVFDKQEGIYWKGRKPQALIGANEAARGYVRLELIHALQIVAEYVSGKNSFYSFELNLVLEDGSRINIVDHGNRRRLVEDAEALGQFLGKPVWDATVNRIPNNVFQQPTTRDL